MGAKKKLKNKLNKIKFPLECGFPQIHFVVATGGLLLMKRKLKNYVPFSLAVQPKYVGGLNISCVEWIVKR